jgi:hypothetical protein
MGRRWFARIDCGCVRQYGCYAGSFGGMHKIRNILAKCVVESVPEIHHLYYKSEATLPFRNENAPADGYLVGGFSEQFVAWKTVEILY